MKSAIFIPCFSLRIHFVARFSFFFFLLSSFFFLFFLSYWTNRILKYLTRNLIFHMPLCQAPKRKRRVSFPCRKQVFFRTNELQRSQQSLVSGVAFPKQVSRPPSCSLTGLWLIWPRLPWVPSVRTQAGKTGRDIKESVFGKGRLGWGVEETCGLTLAALIAAHSRWINPWICFKLPLSSPPSHLFWIECDTPRCPRLIIRSDIAHWWPNLLTYLLELCPNAEGGRLQKQYFSQRCYKATFLSRAEW